MLSYLSKHPRLLRLYRNAGIVFGGNVVASLLGLVTLAVITRGLTLEDFGRYALIMAYVGLIDRLTSFQTWQALIHYGAEIRRQADPGQLMSLFAVGWLLDLAGGAVGFLLALVGASLVPHWFGLGEDALRLTAIASTTLLVNWTAAPTAFLRLYDRFHLQAIHQKVSAGLTLATVTALWMSGAATLTPYIAGVALCGLFSRLLLVGIGIREAGKQGVWRPERVDIPAVFARCPGLWRFVLTTNADGVVRVLRDMDIFIVNAMLGTSAVSLYRIARALTQAFGRFTGPFYQAIYPELADLAAEGRFDEFRRLARQSSLTVGAIVGAAWLAFVGLGPYVLPLVFSSGYADAHGVAVACLAGMVVWALAQPLSPAMMALGKVEISLVIHLATSVAYVLVLVAGVSLMGLVGAGVSLLFFHMSWSVTMWFAIRRELRTRTDSLRLEPTSAVSGRN